MFIDVEKTKAMVVDITHLISPPIQSLSRKKRWKLDPLGSAHLEELKQAGLNPAVWISFYWCVVKSILLSSIAGWYGDCTVACRKALHQVIKSFFKYNKQLPPLCRGYVHQQVQKQGLEHHRRFLPPSSRNVFSLSLRQETVQPEEQNNQSKVQFCLPEAERIMNLTI